MAVPLLHRSTAIHGKSPSRGSTLIYSRDYRRQHRKIARSLLTPKAVEGYASVLDYESHILVRSLYHESMQGALPINPAHYAGRYALKYLPFAHTFTRILTLLFQHHVDHIFRYAYGFHIGSPGGTCFGPGV